MKCYFPQNVLMLCAKFKLGLHVNINSYSYTDCCSRLISRPDVSTSCELAVVTRGGGGGKATMIF